MRRGITAAPAEIMLASITESTLKQYQSPINAWREYCNTNNLDFFSSSIPNIISFLTDRFNRGSSYNTLNSTRSALSLIIGPRLSEDDRIKRFLKGVFKLRPTIPKYDHVWDVSLVLNHFKNNNSNNNMSLEDLTKKAVTLIAISTGHRIQTISLIMINNIVQNVNQLQINIPDCIKTTAPGRYQPNLIIPFFQDEPKICPAKTLIDYMHRTKDHRSDVKNIFITYKKPYKKATVSTISRWIKDTLKNSGININIFTAYSTRHASTSAAAKKGVNIDEIRRTAGWTSQSQTFAKFYNRPIINQPNFARAVLSDGDN